MNSITMYGGPDVVADVEDPHDIGMDQLLAHVGFAEEQRDLLRLVAVTPPQHFHGDHLLGLRMDGAEHAGERAGADHVQHPVVPVEKALAVPFQDLVQLKVGQERLVQQTVGEHLQFDVPGADLAPHALQLTLVQQAEIEDPLRQVIRIPLHDRKSLQITRTSGMRTRRNKGIDECLSVFHFARQSNVRRRTAVGRAAASAMARELHRGATPPLAHPTSANSNAWP